MKIHIFFTAIIAVFAIYLRVPKENQSNFQIHLINNLKAEYIKNI